MSPHHIHLAHQMQDFQLKATLRPDPLSASLPNLLVTKIGERGWQGMEGKWRGGKEEREVLGQGEENRVHRGK